MNLPDFLTADAHGDIRVTGHRVGLLHLVGDYNLGHSVESLASLYPSLSLSLIHRVVAFYLDNRVEVDAFVDRVRAELVRQEATGVNVNTEALRERLLRQVRSKSVPTGTQG